VVVYAVGPDGAGYAVSSLHALSRLRGVDNGKTPSFDVNWLLAYQRKNIEAFTAAHQRAVEGAQAVAKRQVELARASAEDLSKATKELVAAGSVEDKMTKQAETAKDVFEAAVANVNELADGAGSEKARLPKASIFAT